MLKFKINNYHKVLLFLCIFSIAYSLILIKIYKYPVLGDERTYYSYGVNLYKGNGYSYQESPPFTQSNLREPGYPLFIYGLFKLSGISKTIIQVSQAILNGIIVAVTYAMAKLISGDQKKALTAALFTAISPAIAGYAALVASETLATLFLILLFLAFLMLLKEKRTTRALGLSALTGLFCGCLALTKMTYSPLLPLICIAVFIARPLKSMRYKAILCIAIVFIGMLLPWLSFNKKTYGNPFFLSNRGGITLAIKAERLKWTPKEVLTSFIYGFSEKLVKKYSPGEYKKIAAEYVEKTVFDKYASFIERGHSEMAADKQLRSDALAGIKNHILKYLVLSVSDFHYMLYFEGVPLSQFTGFFKSGVRTAINAFFKFYSLLVIFLAVKGTFIMFQAKEDTILKAAFLIPVFYTFFIYSAVYGIPRFTFPVIPFIYILASLSICNMTKIKTLR